MLCRNYERSCTIDWFELNLGFVKPWKKLLKFSLDPFELNQPLEEIVKGIVKMQFSFIWAKSMLYRNCER